METGKPSTVEFYQLPSPLYRQHHVSNDCPVVGDVDSILEPIGKHSIPVHLPVRLFRTTRSSRWIGLRPATILRKQLSTQMDEVDLGRSTLVVAGAVAIESANTQVSQTSSWR